MSTTINTHHVGPYTHPMLKMEDICTDNESNITQEPLSFIRVEDDHLKTKLFLIAQNLFRRDLFRV